MVGDAGNILCIDIFDIGILRRRADQADGFDVARHVQQHIKMCRAHRGGGVADVVGFPRLQIQLDLEILRRTAAVGVRDLPPIFIKNIPLCIKIAGGKVNILARG